MNDESHIGSSAGLQATLVQQTVLPSTPVSPVTARKKTVTSTANSTDSQTTPMTTAGVSKTPTPTLAVVSTKTAVASTRFLMTYRTPSTDVFSLLTKTGSLALVSRILNGTSTVTVSLSPSSKTRRTNRHRKNSLMTLSNSSQASPANSTECAQAGNNRSSTPLNPR